MSQSIGNHLQDVFHFLKAFFKNPLEEIKKLPNWSIQKVMVTYFILAVASGFITGFIPPSLWKILQGIILFPLIAMITGAVLAAFFYYYFQIFERRTIEFQRLLTLVYFANLPFFLFHIISSLFAPTDLIGLAMTAILLIVGLTENFQMPKKHALRLIAAIFGVLFLLWLSEKVIHYQALLSPGTEQSTPS